MFSVKWHKVEKVSKQGQEKPKTFKGNLKQTFSTSISVIILHCCASLNINDSDTPEKDKFAFKKGWF